MLDAQFMFTAVGLQRVHNELQLRRLKERPETESSLLFVRPSPQERVFKSHNYMLWDEIASPWIGAIATIENDQVDTEALRVHLVT
jgi:hypothetical protein